MQPANLVLFIGKEPHLRWRTFGECIFRLARQVGVEPDRIRRLVWRCRCRTPACRGCTSPAPTPSCCRRWTQYGVRRSGYQGPGSFTTYLMTQAKAVGLDMVSLVAEIPGYLQGTNPASIEAVTRRLAKLLKLHLDLAPLRAASTDLGTGSVEGRGAEQRTGQDVRQLEDAYDNELLRSTSDET